MCVINYVYKVGDYLFDSITFMLQFLGSFNSLCVNIVIHLKYCLQMQTPLAMWCRQLELYPKFLHDSHNGQASTK
jgi:hypothetical protein